MTHVIFAYCAFVSLLTVGIDWLRPRIGRWRLILAASLPVPVAMAAVSAYFLSTIGPPAPGEIDAGAMAAMAFIVIGTIWSTLALLLGLLVAWLTTRFLRG